MKQRAFQERHGRLWQQIEESLDGSSITDPRQLPRLHRALCHTLSIARQRGYSPALVSRLENLALGTHRRLYSTSAEAPMLFRNLLLVDFPRAVRREWRMVLIAMLAFWGTALVVGISTYVHPDLTWMWIDPSEAEQYRSMYQPAMQKLGRNGTSGDIQMFGFYIWNNVSIGFRTFAGGLFLGIPALISLASNGVNLGVVGSVLTRDAQTREPFWSFVITHSSFEITGLVLTGAAGLILGLSLLAPKSLPRKQSLIQAGKRTLPILVGASLMVVLAAFFEAFWSAQTNVTPLVKYIVGGSCWSLMTLWFVLAGRSHEA